MGKISRVIASILSVFLLLTLFGCNKKPAEDGDNDGSLDDPPAEVSNDIQDNPNANKLEKHPYMDAHKISDVWLSEQGVVLTSLTYLDDDRALFSGYTSTGAMQDEMPVFHYSAWIYSISSNKYTQTSAQETSNEIIYTEGGGLLENGDIWVCLIKKVFILSSSGTAAVSEVSLPEGCTHASVSPDGSKIAYSIQFDFLDFEEGLNFDGKSSGSTGTEEPSNDDILDIIIGEDGSEVIYKDPDPDEGKKPGPDPKQYGIFVAGIDMKNAKNIVPLKLSGDGLAENATCAGFPTWFDRNTISYIGYGNGLVLYGATVKADGTGNTIYDELFETEFRKVNDKLWFFTESMGTGFGLFDPSLHKLDRVDAAALGAGAVVTRAAISPDGGRIALSYHIEERTFFAFMNVADKQIIKRYEMGDSRESGVFDMAFSPDGKHLIIIETGISYDMPNEIYIIDIEALKLG